MGPSWSLPRPLVNVGRELDNREVKPMPWTAEDAERHTRKADSAKRQRMWAEIANSVLADRRRRTRHPRGQRNGRERSREAFWIVVDNCETRTRAAFSTEHFLSSAHFEVACVVAAFSRPTQTINSETRGGTYDQEDLTNGCNSDFICSPGTCRSVLHRSWAGSSLHGYDHQTDRANHCHSNRAARI